jgi:hypothetical protein
VCGAFVCTAFFGDMPHFAPTFPVLIIFGDQSICLHNYTVPIAACDLLVVAVVSSTASTFFVRVVSSTVVVVACVVVV